MRYFFVSILNTALGQVTIGILFGVAHWSAFRAAIAATLAVSIPSFVLYRHWVWSPREDGHVPKEFRRFVAASVLTLVASSSAASAAESLARGLTQNRLAQTVFVMFGTLVPLFALWVLRFLFFDAAVFGPKSVPELTA